MDIDQQFDTWYHSQTSPNMNKVLSSMVGDMDRAIQTAGGKPSPLTRGFAKKAVVKAMKSYKPGAGTKFRTWAQTSLRQLVRPVRQSRFTVKIPEQRARQAAKVRSLIDEIQAETGFEPSDATIADRLALPMSRVASARGGSAPEVTSGEIFANAEPADESALINDMVYYSLAPRDQTIMEYAFGYNGVKPLKAVEIARRLKVSPAAISQRLAKIRQLMSDAEDGL